MIFDRLWRIFCYANCLSKMFRKISQSRLNSSSLSKIVFKTQKEYWKQFWIIQFYFISFKRSKLVTWNDKIVEILHWNLPEICFKVDQKSASKLALLTIIWLFNPYLVLTFKQQEIPLSGCEILQDQCLYSKELRLSPTTCTLRP